MFVTKYVAMSALVLTFFGTTALNAQKERDSKTEEGTQLSVKGCLSQGNEPNVYMIKDADGKSYSLVSEDVKLKPHVGHEVSVTGAEVSAHENTASNRASTPKLRVDSLKMISTKCAQ